MLFNGKLIVFSGLDGCGKSTQLEKCTLAAKKKDKKCIVLWSRGGYTPGFLFLKKILRFLFKKKLPQPGHSKEKETLISNTKISNTWLVFSIMDMIFYYGIYFRFLTFIGYNIYADRYLLDTFIDFKLNFKASSFDRFSSWKLLKFFAAKPTHSIYLDIDLNLALERRKQKFEPFPDSEETLASRLKLYKSHLKEYRYTVIDSRDSVEKVNQKIQDTLHEN